MFNFHRFQYLKQDFMACFERIKVIKSGEPNPEALIPIADMPFWSEVAKERHSKGKNSRYQGRFCERTGLLGELALHRTIGNTPETAFNDFCRGIGGDGGVDRVINGITVDVKSSRRRDGAYFYNDNNRHRDEARAILFTYLAEESEYWRIALKGWAWKADLLHPKDVFIKQQGKNLFIRYDKARHRKLIKPYAELWAKKYN